MVTAPIPARVLRDELPPMAERWLHDGDGGAWKYLTRVPLDVVWDLHKARIIAEHIKRFPGTRPRRWWEYSAPGPRLRVGGVGTLLEEFTAVGAFLEFGIPSAQSWRRRGDFTGTRDLARFPPIDPGNPPLYESQATFLRRHNLLQLREARHLTDANFEPEAVE